MLEQEKESLLNSSLNSNTIPKNYKFNKGGFNSLFKDSSSSTDNDVDEVVAMRKKELASKIFHDNQRHHFHTLGFLFVIISIFIKKSSSVQRMYSNTVAFNC